VQHLSHASCQCADRRDGVGRRKLYPRCEFELRLALGMRSKGNDYVMPVGSCPVSMSLGDVRWNRNRGTAKLRCQPKQFLARERSRKRVDVFREVHTELPCFQIFVRRNRHVGPKSNFHDNTLDGISILRVTNPESRNPNPDRLIEIMSIHRSTAIDGLKPLGLHR
jgi:hypothetical protein